MKIDKQLDDTAAVREVMQQYIDGAGGRPELLRQAFHADAMMFGNMGSRRWDVPITRFIERVAKADTPPPGPNYRAELTSIMITGDIATVQLVEQDYFGMDFANWFTLARFEDGWQIVAKAYTSPGPRGA